MHKGQYILERDILALSAPNHMEDGQYGVHVVLSTGTDTAEMIFYTVADESDIADIADEIAQLKAKAHLSGKPDIKDEFSERVI